MASEPQPRESDRGACDRAPRVGVLPAAELARRRRLFDALAASLEVVFVGGEGGAARGLDVAVVFGRAAPEGLVSLVLEPDVPHRGGMVELHDTPSLDPRLRGRALHDERALGPPLPLEPGDTVLASCEGNPAWVKRRSGREYAACVSPRELGAEESLRDQLVDGRFLGLLPLVEFLRTAAGAARWTPPPPRACVVLDDPNLHRTTYGHVDFRELATHARRFGYHVAVATIPADQWLVSKPALALFRSSAGLSLAIHGNDHVRRELARPLDTGAREALVGQALRRVEGLERRTGLHVARVMVAPHESCSDEIAATMLRSEIEALCYGRGTRSATRPLADWEIVDLRGAGLPILPRRPLGASRGELVLRAYLDQPLILGCHHHDLAGGLDVLAETAAELGAIAQPRWLPLDAIARANVATLLDGNVLRVRTFARRFEMHVPAGVQAVAVELPATHGEPDRELLQWARAGVTETRAFAGRRAEPIAVAEGERLELALRRVDAFDHHCTPSPRRSPWALSRRLAAESRDRLLALR